MSATSQPRASTASALGLFEPVLARLEQDSPALFGATGRLIPLERHERPFSHVLRAAVRFDGGADRHVFVKVFKPKPDVGVEKMRARVEHDFHVTRRIFDAMSGSDGLGAVHPIACYVDHLAIVTEQAEGETLSAFFDRRARWFPSTRTRDRLGESLTSVGRWIRAFQAVDPGSGTIALSDLRAYVDVRLERLTTHRVIDPGWRARVLGHLDAVGAGVDPAELREVIVHADLAPGNVLVSGPRVVVLDFAMVQRGSTLHDISRLYLQLDVLRTKPQFRQSVVRQMQSALLTGFDPTLTAERPLFRYLLMLHRVNHFATLSLKPEGFPASAFSSRVRLLHRTWMNSEVESGATSATTRR